MSEMSRHDPTDHDCRGGVKGDRYPLDAQAQGPDSASVFDRQVSLGILDGELVIGLQRNEEGWWLEGWRVGDAIDPNRFSVTVTPAGVVTIHSKDESVAAPNVSKAGS